LKNIISRIFLCSLFAAIFALTSCQHLKNAANKKSSPTGKTINSMNLSPSNEKFYFEDASEAEIFNEVVEVEDDFEQDLSPEDNELLKEILEKNALDLKFGARYDIPITINPQVIYFIRYFQTRGRRHFKKWLKRGETHIPYIRKILKEADMPQDLVFVSMIESGFSPKAYSRAGAAGPWQFMKYTGRKYGLKINWWQDERRDIEKSTRAAIKYLKFLYEKFGDWYLAISAYNAGEGKSGRAIKKYKTKDYWELCKYRYIRVETKNYVPKMIAAALIVKNLKEYGFSEIQEKQFPETKYAVIKKPTDLFKVAKYTGTTYKRLKKANPELTRWCTPPDTKNYMLKLPEDTEDSLITTLTKKLKTDKITFKRHIVRYGENLWKIARRYGTTIRQIKKMNKLVNSRIRIGQSLGIPVRYNPGAKSFSRKRKSIPVKKIVRSRKPEKANEKLISYSVKRGDTLWTIASNHRVSPNHIRRYNPNLKRGGRKIFAGQKILIPAKEAESTISSLPVVNKKSTIFHTVRAGENLTTIADKYTTTIKSITGLNNIDRDDVIRPGDLLKIRDL